MTTVMTWGNSDGIKGRCDAKCHNAAGSKCTCMCGGRYHGSALEEGGVEQLQRDNFDEVCQEAKARAAKLGYKLAVADVQRLLFSIHGER